MLKKSRNLNLPVNLTSQLFDVVVIPVILYGCEIFAPGSHQDIEKVNLKKFCKYLLGLSDKTTNVMAYGETGRRPLEIQIKTRAITYWSKLFNGKPTKLSYIIYTLLYQLHLNNIFMSDWIKFTNF